MTEVRGDRKEEREERSEIRSPRSGAGGGNHEMDMETKRIRLEKDRDQRSYDGGHPS